MLGKNIQAYTNLNTLYLPVLPPGPQCTRLHPSSQLSLSTLNLLKSSTPYSLQPPKVMAQRDCNSSTRYGQKEAVPLLIQAARSAKPNVLLLLQSGRAVSANVSSLTPKQQTQWPDLLSLSSTSGKGGCCSNRESCEVRPAKIFQKPLTRKLKFIKASYVLDLTPRVR